MFAGGSTATDQTSFFASPSVVSSLVGHVSSFASWLMLALLNRGEERVFFFFFVIRTFLGC